MNLFTPRNRSTPWYTILQCGPSYKWPLAYLLTSFLWECLSQKQPGWNPGNKSDRFQTSDANWRSSPVLVCEISLKSSYIISFRSNSTHVWLTENAPEIDLACPWLKFLMASYFDTRTARRRTKHATEIHLITHSIKRYFPFIPEWGNIWWQHFERKKLKFSLRYSGEKEKGNDK